MFESAHFSRRLNVPPTELVEAAAKWHLGLPTVGVGRRSVRVSRGFWLSSDAVVRREEHVEQFEVRGVLWTCGRPVPVILEFSPWSKTQSEVGVTPRTLAWPVGAERYQRRVETMLEVVDQTLFAIAYQSAPSVVSLETPGLLPGLLF